MSQQYSEGLGEQSLGEQGLGEQGIGEQAVSEYVDALASELEAQAVEAQAEALGEMEASLGQMSESEQKELSELCTGIMTGRINLEQQGVTEQFLPAILGAAKFLLPKVLPMVKPIIMKQGGALAARLFGRPGANILFKGARTILGGGGGRRTRMPTPVTTGRPAPRIAASAGAGNFVDIGGIRYKLVRVGPAPR